LNGNSTFSGAGLVASQGTGANANKLIITGPVDDSSSDNGNSTLVVSPSTLSDTTPAGTTPGSGENFTSGTISSLTASSAQNVLTAVTSAISDVAYQRGVMGANMNQLTAASNVASTESENLSAAQSNIQSTDYGQATTNMAKYQVLSQTGIAALAQANSVQQEVLKLLQ